MKNITGILQITKETSSRDVSSFFGVEKKIKRDLWYDNEGHINWMVVDNMFHINGHKGDWNDYIIRYKGSDNEYYIVLPQPFVENCIIEKQNVFTLQEVKELGLAAMNLGMEVRQNQLRGGGSDKSGKEIYEEWFNEQNF